MSDFDGYPGDKYGDIDEMEYHFGNPHAEPSYRRTTEQIDARELTMQATADEILAPKRAMTGYVSPARRAAAEDERGDFTIVVGRLPGIRGDMPIGIARTEADAEALIDRAALLGMLEKDPVTGKQLIKKSRESSLRRAKLALMGACHLAACPADAVFPSANESFEPVCLREGFVPNTGIAAELEARYSAENKGSWAYDDLDAPDHIPYVKAPNASEFAPERTAVVCGFAPKDLYPDATTAQYSRNGYFRAFSDINSEIVRLADAGAITSIVATEEQGASQLGFWAASSAKKDCGCEISTILALPWANRGSVFNGETSPVFSRVDMDGALACADSIISFTQNDGAANSLLNCVPTEGVDAPGYGEGLPKDQFREVNSNRNNWIAENCGHAICATPHGVATVSALPGQTIKPLDGMTPATIARALDFAVSHDIASAEQAMSFSPSTKDERRELRSFAALAGTTNICAASAALRAEKAQRNGAKAYGPQGTVSSREITIMEPNKKAESIPSQPSRKGSR